MALLIDTNRAGDFEKPLANHALLILKKIKEKRVRIAIGGQLLAELSETPLRSLIAEWARSGRLVRPDANRLVSEETAVSAIQLQSNDSHIIALARCLNCRLIYTDDNALIRDFKDRSVIRPRGKVIRTATPSNVAAGLLTSHGR